MSRSIVAALAAVIMICTAPICTGEPVDRSSDLANTLTDIGNTVPSVAAGTMTLLGNQR